MAVEIVTYVDPDGRMWRRFVPPGTPESDYKRGVPVFIPNAGGQPDLTALNLPLDIEVALHNELFHRGIWDYKTAKAKRSDIQGALMAALRIDTGRILELFMVDGP